MKWLLRTWFVVATVCTLYLIVTTHTGDGVTGWPLWSSCAFIRSHWTAAFMAASRCA